MTIHKRPKKGFGKIKFFDDNKKQMQMEEF